MTVAVGAVKATTTTSTATAAMVGRATATRAMALVVMMTRAMGRVMETAPPVGSGYGDQGYNAPTYAQPGYGQPGADNRDYGRQDYGTSNPGGAKLRRLAKSRGQLRQARMPKAGIPKIALGLMQQATAMSPRVALVIPTMAAAIQRRRPGGDDTPPTAAIQSDVLPHRAIPRQDLRLPATPLPPPGSGGQPLGADSLDDDPWAQSPAFPRASP